MRGCARGATVERSETVERTMIAPAGQSTARACLRSKLAALVVRRQAGPATWGLHAPKTPNKEVGRPTGYANAVLLFELNACGPSSVLKFGSCGVASAGPQLSAAKLGSEQCLPLRGKQPYERVCAANWRRSLCAAKRPRTPAGGRWRPPCQRELAALADWGIPTGCAWPPIPGQPPHAERGRAAALPRPSRPRPVYGSL